MNIYTYTIKAGEFKASCLELMDIVKQEHIEYIITKRGVPIAKLVPIEEVKTTPFGCMQGTIVHMGDLISPIDVEWNVDDEENLT